MNPHCRIGKWTDKQTGNSVQRFPDKNLTVHTTDCNFHALKRANKLVRRGRAKMVAVAVIYDDGWTYTDFSKQKGVTGAEVLGTIELLRGHAMDWMKS